MDFSPSIFSRDIHYGIVTIIPKLAHVGDAESLRRGGFRSSKIQITRYTDPMLETDRWSLYGDRGECWRVDSAEKSDDALQIPIGDFFLNKLDHVSWLFGLLRKSDTRLNVFDDTVEALLRKLGSSRMRQEHAGAKCDKCDGACDAIKWPEMWHSIPP